MEMMDLFKTVKEAEVVASLIRSEGSIYSKTTSVSMKKLEVLLRGTLLSFEVKSLVDVKTHLPSIVRHRPATEIQMQALTVYDLVDEAGALTNVGIVLNVLLQQFNINPMLKDDVELSKELFEKRVEMRKSMLAIMKIYLPSGSASCSIEENFHRELYVAKRCNIAKVGNKCGKFEAKHETIISMSRQKTKSLNSMRSINTLCQLQLTTTTITGLRSTRRSK